CLVRQLLDEGWHVEASGRIYRQPGRSSLALSSGIDWFEVHGHIEYEGHRASLPALLAALNRGETFVTLDDGSLGLLPEEWLRRQGLLARLGTASGDHVRFKPSQAALLDALIASQPEATWDEGFARARAARAGIDRRRPRSDALRVRGARCRAHDLRHDPTRCRSAVGRALRLRHSR